MRDMVGWRRFPGHVVSGLHTGGFWITVKCCYSQLTHDLEVRCEKEKGEGHGLVSSFI